MKTKNKKIWAMSITTGTIVLIALVIIFLQWPANIFTLDINPSLEITTNRLGQFVNVKGLNDDGREFLEDYEVKDRNLEDAINDLIDRMILTGHISGGKDNVVMISVNNDELDKAYVEKVNVAIAAYLENKQLEYLILNQGFDDDFDDSDYQDMSKGKATVVQKIIDQNNELSAEELADVSLKDLLIIAERLGLSPQEVFARSIGEYDFDDDNDNDEASDTSPEVIGRKRAIEIAKDRVGGGEVEEFEYDRDDQKYEIELKFEGYEYEVEIDAVTGAITDFEQDDELDEDDRDDDDKDEASDTSPEEIGRERAIEIAKDRVGGGEVEEFEYDRDDQEYEIKLRYEGYEYEIEINAVSGAITDFEQDDDFDDDDNDEASDTSPEVIGRERAIEIAKDRVGGGEVEEFEYDRDDQEYEIKLRYEGYEYDVEINAVSGAITDFEQDDDLDDDDKDEASDTTEKVIGRERAIEIAKDRIGGGEVEEFEYDQDDQEYEIKLRYEGYEYEVEINAITGAITDFEQDDDIDNEDDRDDDEDRDDDDKDEVSDTTEEVIGRERAIKIARDRVGGGEVEEFEYDQDDQKYEIELKHEDYEYEVEINAITGAIIDFERDE